MTRGGWNGRRRLGGALAAMCLLALLALPAAVGAAPGSVLLRVVQASPGAPMVTVAVDGQPVTAALRFAEVTSYVAVPGGTHRLQVFAAGAGAGGKALLDTTVTLQDPAYTIVAAEPVQQMTALVLSDTTAAAPPSQAVVRLVHASPDAPHVADVAVAGGGPIVAKGLAYKSATGYFPVAAGTYRFEVRPAGAALALATTPPIALAGGRSYSIFVVGLLGDGTFQAVLAPDNARTGGTSAAPATGAGAARLAAGVGGWAPALGLGAVAVVALAGAAARRRLARAMG